MSPIVPPGFGEAVSSVLLSEVILTLSIFRIKTLELQVCGVASVLLKQQAVVLLSVNQLLILE